MSCVEVTRGPPVGKSRLARPSPRMLTTTNDGHEFLFQWVEAADKGVFNVIIDGGMDSTFDIAIPTRLTMNLDAGLADTVSVDPVLIVGDHSNLKAQIVAGEIGKMVISLKKKPLVVSMATKWFGSDVQEGDFERLMWVLQKVKETLQ